MMSGQPRPIELEKKGWPADGELQQAIYRVVESVDLTQVQGWEDITVLAPQVEPESIVVYVEGMLGDGGSFTVPADLTVRLIYSDDPADPMEFEDNYPAQLRFTWNSDKKSVELVSIKVDVSSFFE